ncbi:MAG: hypothetical protein H6727_02420 [Myxococcales bacterium]|nr:hypothetical protein [Myxococcales bacterium]
MQTNRISRAHDAFRHPQATSWLFSFSISCFLALLLSCYAPQQAHAQVNPQRILQKDKITGFYANLGLTLSYNLLGLRLLGDVGYRWRLFASQSRILQDNYILLGATSAMTPAWMDVGAFVHVQPLSIFSVRGMYRYRFQLPTFFSGVVFEDMNKVNEVFNGITGHQTGEQRMRDRIQEVSNSNNDRRVLPTSHIFSVDATLRFQLKGVTALVNARYAKWLSQHDKSDVYKTFYEGGLDIIMNNEDDLITVNALLGYEWKMLLFVAYTNYSKAFQSGEEIWRLGPAVRWTLAPNWGPFKKPNLFFVVNWYLKHRFRAAALDGVPLIAVVFGGLF